MPALDPSPRSYPPAVTLLRRSQRGREAAPQQSDFAAIEDWLLGDAMACDDLLELFEALVWRLVAAGLPLDRASLHVGTLHPQLFGFAWNWNSADRLCDEVKVTAEALAAPAYRRNPLFQVIDRGEEFRGNPADGEVSARFPLMAELARQGFSDYAAIPLRAGAAYHNAATVATQRPGGFSLTQFAAARQVLRLFALHVERHIALRIAANVLDTYLGRAAGTQVLRGAIRRGSGASIEAIIWSSDLRGFTDLADRLPPPVMTALLNAYFERLVDAVMAHKGEVLKFIGDGLLAVFPFASFADRDSAARAAYAAALAALESVSDLHLRPPAELAAVDGWGPLRSGIALHEGEVFFGNVGAPSRLDFTVIGGAVNAASRVESLSKIVGRSLLITAPVAHCLGIALDSLGEHALRGLAAPIEIFSPSQ